MSEVFNAFHSDILAEFPGDCDIMRHVLLRLAQEDSVASVKELGALAQELSGLEKDDAPESDFEIVVRKVLQLIRVEAIVLFLHGQNSQGYTLSRGEEVRWVKNAQHAWEKCLFGSIMLPIEE